jgi:UDP-N-acetylglucosamine 2-epimerase
VYLDLLSKPDLEVELACSLGPEPLVLCTYHPVTLHGDDGYGALLELFKALDCFPKIRVVFTKSNADAGGRAINQAIDQFVAEHPDRMAAFITLGQVRYLSLLSMADVVLGNSSSAIIEAPTACTATVNIGERQKGRLYAPSVICCTESASSISAALNQALLPEFRNIVRKGETFYGEAGAVATRIKQEIKQVQLGGILLKHFYDLPDLA